MPDSRKQKTPVEVLDAVIDKVIAKVLDGLKKHPGDFTRTRKLPVDMAIKAILNMQAQSIRTELAQAFPDPDDRITAAAFEKAKDKLCKELFLKILEFYNEEAPHLHLAKDMYQLFAIDGTDLAFPYNKDSIYALTKASGRPRKDGLPSKLYCMVHANLLYDVTNSLFRDIVFQPKEKADERGAAIEILSRLNPDHPYIVLMDRGYDGFNMIEHCNRLNGNGYYIIRTKAGKGAIREIENLPDRDCDEDMAFVVTTSSEYYSEHKKDGDIHYIHAVKTQHKKYLSPNTKRQKWDFGPIVTVKCRVVKFRVGDEEGKGKWEVLITNLPRDEFSLKDLKEAYHLRWQIETAFRDYKYSLSGLVFHSKKDDFIEMEIIAHLIMYNVARRTADSVSVPQKMANKRRYAISFKDTVTVVHKYLSFWCTDPPIRIFDEILHYLRPADSGKPTKRDIRPKSAVWFVYRVA